MKSGQSLVILLVFMTIALVITSTAATINIVSSVSTSQMETGQEVALSAESGMENALLRLLRNPDYSGEILTVGNGTSTITVTGANPYTVTSRAASGDYVRQIQAVVQFANGIMTTTSWHEIFSP